MTSSDKVDHQARMLLAQVTNLLGEEHLQQRIDDPVTAARASFACPETPNYSEAEFRRLIADFWRHLWRETVGQDLGFSAALGEAIAFLDKGYRGTHSEGYPPSRSSSNFAAFAVYLPPGPKATAPMCSPNSCATPPDAGTVAPAAVPPKKDLLHTDLLRQFRANLCRYYCPPRGGDHPPPDP